MQKSHSKPAKKPEKGIADFFPPKTTATKLFQCWVDTDLLKQANAQRKRDKRSWRHLVEACFMRYLSETKPPLKKEA